MKAGDTAPSRQFTPKARSGGSWLLPLALFLLLAIGTVAAWHWQSRVQAQADELIRNQESAAITAAIRERLHLHSQFLRSLQAFASSAPSQDLATWQRFAGAIDHEGSLDGMFAFAYAPAVQQNELPAFQNSPKFRVDRSNFQIFPQTGAAVATPIVFIAPDTPLLRTAIGFDLLSESVRRDAVERAIASRDIAITGPVILLTDRNSQRHGFQLIQAIFKSGEPVATAEQRQRAFTGVVLAAYRFDEFMSSIKLAFNSRFDLRILDEALGGETGEASAPSLIYESAPNAKPAQESAMLHHEIDFGGRNWVLQFYPRDQDNPTFDPPALVLYGGLTGSLLLALLVYYLATHRERAEQYARKLNQELSRHRDHLQELVVERTASLDTALIQARAANQAKSEFLANMTHELRTPMHAILGFVELGSKRLRADNDPKIAHYLQRIDQSGRRLLGLIDELLDLSKLNAGRMLLHPEKFDIFQLLEQIAGQAESLLTAKTIRVTINCHTEQTQIVADRERISQAFWNLLSNAIKFSPEQGTIIIDLSPTTLPSGRRADDKGLQPALAISFIDEGIGIPADELESIFDKFVQSSATKSGAGGTGLGLAICRAIIEQHRGTIVAQNKLGNGACFVATLPLKTRIDTSETNESETRPAG